MTITTEDQAQAFLASLSAEDRERVSRILELFQSLPPEEQAGAIAAMERAVGPRAGGAA